MRILLSNPDIDILEYPVTKNYESPQSEVISFNPEKVSGNNIFPDWIKRKGYEHCFSCNKIYRAELFNFIRFPEGEVFEDTYITPMLYESAYNVYYSDCGFYYYYKNEGSITSNHSFKSRYFLFKNTFALYEKVIDTYKMQDEAKEILLKTLDRLTDLHCCSDGKKEEYAKARKMLKGKKIPVNELFKMDIPAIKKIKYSIFSLLGFGAHCFVFRMFNKKLF